VVNNGLTKNFDGYGLLAPRAMRTGHPRPCRRATTQIGTKDQEVFSEAENPVSNTLTAATRRYMQTSSQVVEDKMRSPYQWRIASYRRKS
jgi:hypothetical protein